MYLGDEGQRSLESAQRALERIPVAYAFGKPVIATICGGPEEFIDESIGYLAQNGNVDDLVAKIISMIDNHTYFNGKIIREKFELQFASSVVTKKLREVYGEVIENHQVKK